MEPLEEARLHCRSVFDAVAFGLSIVWGLCYHQPAEISRFTTELKTWQSAWAAYGNSRGDPALCPDYGDLITLLRQVLHAMAEHVDRLNLGKH
jgi:hypothetical protein